MKKDSTTFQNTLLCASFVMVMLDLGYHLILSNDDPTVAMFMSSPIVPIFPAVLVVIIVCPSMTRRTNRQHFTSLIIFALFYMGVEAIKAGLDQVAIAALVVTAVLILATKCKYFRIRFKSKSIAFEAQVDSQPEEKSTK